MYELVRIVNARHVKVTALPKRKEALRASSGRFQKGDDGIANH